MALAHGGELILQIGVIRFPQSFRSVALEFLIIGKAGENGCGLGIARRMLVFQVIQVPVVFASWTAPARIAGVTLMEIFKLCFTLGRRGWIARDHFRSTARNSGV